MCCLHRQNNEGEMWNQLDWTSHHVNIVNIQYNLASSPPPLSLPFSTLYMDILHALYIHLTDQFSDWSRDVLLLLAPSLNPAYLAPHPVEVLCNYILYNKLHCHRRLPIVYRTSLRHRMESIKCIPVGWKCITNCIAIPVNSTLIRQLKVWMR